MRGEVELGSKRRTTQVRCALGEDVRVRLRTRPRDDDEQRTGKFGD